MKFRAGVTFRLPEPFPYRNRVRTLWDDGQDEPDEDAELTTLLYEWQDQYDIQWELVFR